MKIGIVGLGYVGLPLAVAFAEAGHEVVGLDTDPRKIEGLNAGRSYIEDILRRLRRRSRERLPATTDYADLAACDAVMICVPTPLTDSREPDLTYMLEPATALAAVLRQGQLVVLESTTYPGTTRERLLPILEESGLSAGRDFHLAFSPERIDPGRTDYTIRTTPKVVGGLTPACSERAGALYSRDLRRGRGLSTPEAAELSKLLENIFRSVNIALVNELAQLCDRLGIDVWEVVDAASTKPFGFMRFDPGPGMGGHCLPVDPFYLSFKAREHDFYPEFIELAGKVNQTQPALLRRADRARAQRRRQGRSRTRRSSSSASPTRPGVGDIRESPALKIIQLLRRSRRRCLLPRPPRPRGPRPRPCLGRAERGPRLRRRGGDRHRPPERRLRERRRRRAPLVVDFRGVTRGIEAENLVRL